jgi:hypothetical protein
MEKDSMSMVMAKLLKMLFPLFNCFIMDDMHDYFFFCVVKNGYKSNIGVNKKFTALIPETEYAINRHRSSTIGTSQE